MNSSSRCQEQINRMNLPPKVGKFDHKSSSCENLRHVAPLIERLAEISSGRSWPRIKQGICALKISYFSMAEHSFYRTNELTNDVKTLELTKNISFKARSGNPKTQQKPVDHADFSKTLQPLDYYIFFRNRRFTHPKRDPTLTATQIKNLDSGSGIFLTKTRKTVENGKEDHYLCRNQKGSRGANRSPPCSWAVNLILSTGDSERSAL